MAKPQNEKMNLNLTAKRNVQAKLHEFGLPAEIRPEGRKTFVFITKNDKIWKVEVHGSRIKRPLTNFFQRHYKKPLPDFWVIVHVNPETKFYVLPPQKVAEEQMTVNKMDKWKKIDGVDNIGLHQLEEKYTDKWEIILDAVNN